MAIVTGAGSGIGRHTAVALHAEGWTVALAGRRLAALEETAAMMGEGVRALCVPTDVTDPDSVAALFDRTRAAYGRLDLLFNNAGISAPARPLDELSAEEAAEVIAVNVTGSLLCAREAMRLMKVQTPRGGRIINNGSVSAYAPRADSVPYATSKHAITGLTKALILDGRAFDIACGQIDIGNASSGLAARITGGGPGEEPRVDMADVARTIVHMAGRPPEANISFVTLMATGMPLYGRG